MMAVTPHFMRNGFISCSLASRKYKDEKSVVGSQEQIKLPKDMLEVMVTNKALIAIMEAEESIQ
jgi:hypothetical protein